MLSAIIFSRHYLIVRSPVPQAFTHQDRDADAGAVTDRRYSRRHLLLRRRRRSPEGGRQAECAPENLKGVPAIAPNYSSDDRSLPDLGRVGVDMTDKVAYCSTKRSRSRSRTTRTSRSRGRTCSIAEFDLQAARGVYEPRFAGQTYYEHSKTPSVQHFRRRPRLFVDAVRTSSVTRSQAQIQQTGGNFNVPANNTRSTTNNPIFTSSTRSYNSDLRLA